MSILHPEIMDAAVQINNGLAETASCGNCFVYDKRRGLVFAGYLTGVPCYYGEATGYIRLAIFAPKQPWNVKRVQIESWVNLEEGRSRGLLCNAIYLIGDAKVRIVYSTERGEELTTFYRDYDYLSDTVSERSYMLFRSDEGDVQMTNASYLSYVRARGYEVESSASPIINKVTKWNDKVYTAITLDDKSYPVLCTIEDNVMIPFAICSQFNTYEFRYYLDDTGIYGVFRYPVDDTNTGRNGFTVSKDGGKTWESKVFEDGIQSRPDILRYYGKPLVIYNYRSDHSQENFPPMHHHRTAIKLIYDGKVLLDVFSKYGIVEHETCDICGDLYMDFSNCEQALMYTNNACWHEDGLDVENGKEKSNWIKLGCLISLDKSAGM